MRVRRFLLLVPTAFAAWLGAGAVFCETALRVPRRPATIRPEEDAAFQKIARTFETVTTTTADGIVLRAWFITAAAGKRDCVLLLQGVADSRASGLGFARLFVSAGYSVLIPDSRAHGESGGSVVTYGLMERSDVLRWAAWMRAQSCERLFGLGESFGAAVLIQAAAQEPVFQAIVAECPFRDLRTIAAERVSERLPVPRPIGRVIGRAAVSSGFLYARMRFGLDLNDASPQRSAARNMTPLLLIHGLADTNIPPAHSQAIAATGQRVTLWLLLGATHTGASAAAPEEFRRRVLEWFEGH